ncbi:MAG TPA: hypothetical protein VN673_10200 [Clostridia bacterium]|nr:hypothetical protein [Clostridia bacterium]
MNRILCALLVCVAWSAAGADATQLENKAKKLIAKFEAMQQKPDKAVPADTLKKAQGAVLLDRTKAGFVFAYQGGGGIAMARDKCGYWGPIAFMQANRGEPWLSNRRATILRGAPDDEQG